MAFPGQALLHRIIILEGPDGGGKTTFGAKLSERIGVEVTNHGPYKDEAQIWKHYFDSMLPAYSGARDVILDRCWLAEPIYGSVMRGGLNRIELWQQRILEHVAGQCRTTVLYFLPGVEHCVATFNSRRAQEYPEREQQIRDIYGLYLNQACEAIPVSRFGRAFIYDFHEVSFEQVMSEGVI